MKILLLQPYLGRMQSPVFPIGLACLGAHLTGHELYGLDLNTIPEPYKALKQALQTFAPEAVLISIRNGDSVGYSDPFCYFPHIQEQIRQIRALAPQTLIIAGGAAFSIFAREMMSRTPEVDLGVMGEAEEIIDALVTQKQPPASFPSVLYRDGTALKGGTRVGITSLDHYPGPRYDLFPMEPYLDNSWGWGVGVETKRGCPLKCNYCTYPNLNGSRLRLIPPDTIVRVLRELKERYGVKRFHITDSIFNMPRAHAEEFLRKLIDAKLGLQWTAYFHESNFDDEFLDLNLAAGINHFWFSPDGLTPRGLKNLGKGQTASDIKRTWRLIMARKNVKANFSFFWQFPQMGWWDFAAMMKFYLGHRFLHKNPNMFIIFNQIRIEPGTAIRSQAVAEGLINADDPLLPMQVEDMMRLFYRRQPRGFFEWSYDFLVYLRKLRAS